MNIFTTLKTGNKSIETNFMHMRVINGLTMVNAPQRRINQYALCRKRSDVENSVDPDQLASERKPADLDLHCFSTGL